jgi:hypothetical protein
MAIDMWKPWKYAEKFSSQGEDHRILGTIARAEQTLGFCKGSLGASSTSFKTLPKR